MNKKSASNTLARLTLEFYNRQIEAQVWRNAGYAEQLYRSITGSNEKLWNDFGVANIPAALGLASPQIFQAVRLVLETLRQHPNAEVSFTGHSLGGGLAT